jgi:hypothetical protein
MATAQGRKLINLKSIERTDEWTLESRKIGRKLCGEMDNALGTLRAALRLHDGHPQRREEAIVAAMMAVESLIGGTFDSAAKIFGSKTPPKQRKAKKATSLVNRVDNFVFPAHLRPLAKIQKQKLKEQLGKLHAAERREHFDDLLSTTELGGTNGYIEALRSTIRSRQRFNMARRRAHDDETLNDVAAEMSQIERVAKKNYGWSRKDLDDMRFNVPELAKKMVKQRKAREAAAAGAAEGAAPSPPSPIHCQIPRARVVAELGADAASLTNTTEELLSQAYVFPEETIAMAFDKRVCPDLTSLLDVAEANIRAKTEATRWARELPTPTKELLVTKGLQDFRFNFQGFRGGASTPLEIDPGGPDSAPIQFATAAGFIDRTIKTTEVWRAARSLSIGTAPGMDGLPNELLREADPRIHEAFATAFEICKLAERVPNSWTVGEQARNPTNYASNPNLQHNTSPTRS